MSTAKTVTTLAGLGFRRKGRCEICNRRTRFEFGWEHLCLACGMGALGDPTYEALGWERPASTLPKQHLPPSLVRYINVGQEDADRAGVPAGTYLFKDDIAEAAEKWNSDILRVVANVETP